MTGFRLPGATSIVVSVTGSLKRRRPAPWIQVKHAIHRGDHRLMGMTGHDDVDAARDRIDLQSLQIVQNVERFSRKSNDLGFGVCSSPVADIHVSSDRGNGSDAPQSVYDFGTSDVAELVSYSKGLLARNEAIRLLGLRDYAELLVALGDADLPMPLPPPHEIENQAAIFVRLWKQT